MRLKSILRDFDLILMYINKQATKIDFVIDFGN